MALPWLIGAAVVGIGAAIAAAVKGDDTSNNNISSSEDLERQRRKEAERERRKQEKQQKRQIAHETFAQVGESIGCDLKASLDGWVDVVFASSPSFLARLNRKGYELDVQHLECPNSTESLVTTLLEKGSPYLKQTRSNLDLFQAHYAVSLQASTQLAEASREMKVVDKAVDELKNIRKDLLRLKRKIIPAQT